MRKKKKHKNNGLAGTILTAAVTLAGVIAADRAEKKQEERVRNVQKEKTKKVVEQVDDLTKVMKYMDSLLAQKRLDSVHYVKIAQQACKEYFQLGGKLNIDKGLDDYVDTRVNIIDGVSDLQQKLRKG